MLNVRGSNPIKRQTYLEVIHACAAICHLERTLICESHYSRPSVIQPSFIQNLDYAELKMTVLLEYLNIGVRSIRAF